MVVAGLAAVQGCATPPPPPRALEKPPGRMMLVASGNAPELRFEGFARGKGEGAARAAGATFASCAAGLGHGACSGPFCGAVAVVWLAICGSAATVGGIVGAASAEDAATVRSAEQALQTALVPATVQEGLRAALADAARTRGSAFSPRGERVVEVGLLRIGTQGRGLDGPLALDMQARARVLRAADGAELQSLELAYQGPARTLIEWSADGGRPLAQAVSTGYARLGVELYELLFQRYPFPDREFQGAGVLAGSFGLAPLEPRVRGQLMSGSGPGRSFEWTTVPSLQPVLRWQAFPRERDRSAAPADMTRVRNVRYDLVIAREEHLAPADEVYRREGLSAPEHRLETPLAPGGHYFWAVRARFELDGQERLTEWSTTHWALFGRAAALSSFSYRFRTP